jgi:RNA polymerase sigma factor (sigma-70 family)
MVRQWRSPWLVGPSRLPWSPAGTAKRSMLTCSAGRTARRLMTCLERYGYARLARVTATSSSGLMPGRGFTGSRGNVLRAEWRRRVPGHHRFTDRGHDPWPDVDARLDATRQRAALDVALGALNPKDREVLLLAAWEHLSPAEIAVSLGIPAGTARWRLHRARAQFRQRLDETTAPPPLACTKET